MSEFARRMAQEIRREVRRLLGPDATFEQRRDAAAALASDALWSDADEDLREAITSADEVEVEGRRYKRLEQASSATYHGRWGSHYIEEPLYRAVGVHNGPTIKPIELRVGIIENMTPDMARVVGELSADKSSRGVERILRATGLVPPSRAFLAKHTTGMGIEIAEQVPNLEAVVRTVEIVPAEVASISTGLDRMSARMCEPADPDTASSPRRTEPYERTPPPPKEHHYRKAWVGMRTPFASVALALIAAVGCRTDDEVRGIVTYAFVAPTRRPQVLSAHEVLAAAQRGMREGERLTSISAYVAHGLGETVVQAVVEGDDDSRAYVVDEDGVNPPPEPPPPPPSERIGVAWSFNN